jgi:class 3 adenylate cyclase
MAVGSGSPERRQLTILVCNMVGATSLSVTPDPEDISDRIAPFHQAVTDAAARFDGFVAQYLSDGVVIYFGYQAATEHDAEQAVRAGLAILDTMRALALLPGWLSSASRQGRGIHGSVLQSARPQTWRRGCRPQQRRARLLLRLALGACKGLTFDVLRAE